MLAPGLYIVATPIGNLGDISFRAIEVLKQVDCIAAEDTRHSKKLLQHFDIRTPTLSLHEHNEKERSSDLLKRLEKQQRVALISDAGTPLISDPGFRLVTLARERQIDVIPIPGACALIAALCVSGFDCREFVFAGFLPAKQTLRQKQLEKLNYETRTIVFYEAPHRILATIQDMLSVFGAGRGAVIARELTKTFENISAGTLKQLSNLLLNNQIQQRGEFVVIVEGSSQPYSMNEVETQRILALLLNELPVKQACALAAKITHKKRNALYAQALKLGAKQHDE